MLEVEQLASRIVSAGAVEIRDVDAGDEPFLYASGNWGPGYVSIKGLVGHKALFKDLVAALAEEMRQEGVPADFIAGNATGGMIPGWILSEILDIPYVYVRETRKKGGQKELVSGIKYIPSGMRGVVVEELINFAESTCNAADALIGLGYVVEDAATVLFYDNPESIRRLSTYSIGVTYLLTLEDLLVAAVGTYSTKAIQGYRQFLQNPLQWQADRGLEPVEKGGTL